MMTADTDATGTVLDPVQYRAIANDPFLPQPCPLSTGSLTCRTTNATIVTLNRRTTLTAWVGHEMNLFNFMRWSGGIANAPGIVNGMAIVEPQFTLGSLPQDNGYTIEATVTNFPVSSASTVCILSL